MSDSRFNIRRTSFDTDGKLKRSCTNQTALPKTWKGVLKPKAVVYIAMALLYRMIRVNMQMAQEIG